MSHIVQNQQQPRVPEPALIRGFIISLTSIIAIIFNINIELGWLDSVLVIYAGLAPFIAGWLIRRKVTPVSIAEFRERKALYTEPPARAA